MEKISINLLPIELRDQSKKNSKQVLVFRSSVGFLVFVIVTVLGVLSWTVIQRSTLQNVNNNLASVTEKIQSQKDKESLVVLLKSRLDIITNLVQKESPQNQSFNLITSLSPTDINILNFSVDKSGTIKLSGFTRSLESMRSFFNNLTDPQKNEGKITSAKVDSLNKNQEGSYSFELLITYSVK